MFSFKFFNFYIWLFLLLRDFLEGLRVPLDAACWLVRWLDEQRPTPLFFPLSPPFLNSVAAFRRGFCLRLWGNFRFSVVGRPAGAGSAFWAVPGGVASGGSVQGCETHSGEKKTKNK